jgi:hypothetical protein
MSRRPAHFTQADIARVLRAARQEGANAVEVDLDGDKPKITIRLVGEKDEENPPDTDKLIALV